MPGYLGGVKLWEFMILLNKMTSRLQAPANDLSYGDIASAISSGNDSSISDWSTGTAPGRGITAAEHTESSLSSFETHLQSLERPESEVATTEPSPDAPSETSPEAKQDVKDEQPAKEELLVTGPDGRKVKVTVDYSDRNAIKKAYEQAAGMRKFQAERDAEKAAYAKLDAKVKSEYEPLKETWSKFEQAWQLGGIEGVVDLIAGQQGAYRQSLEKYANATPDERIQMERQLAEEKIKRAEAQRQSEIDRKLQEVNERLEKADEKETMALVSPVFQKYRFAGQLGDEVAEHHLDKAIWGQALERLESYDGEVTQDVVDSVFKEVSSALRRATSKQAERTIKTAVAKKKDEATSQAAAAAMKGMQSPNKSQSLESRLWAGDTVGVLAELFRGARK